MLKKVARMFLLPVVLIFMLSCIGQYQSANSQDEIVPIPPVETIVFKHGITPALVKNMWTYIGDNIYEPNPFVVFHELHFVDPASLTSGEKIFAVLAVIAPDTENYFEAGFVYRLANGVIYWYGPIRDENDIPIGGWEFLGDSTGWPEDVLEKWNEQFESMWLKYLQENNMNEL